MGKMGSKAGTNFQLFGKFKGKQVSNYTTVFEAPYHNVFITCEKLQKKNTAAAYSACVMNSQLA